MVGRQAFPFGMVYFQGRAVKLPGGNMNTQNDGLEKVTPLKKKSNMAIFGI